MKPAHLLERGGVWFEQDDLKLHLGVDDNFYPAKKPHPGLLVEDLDRLVSRCKGAGYSVVMGGGVENYRRAYVTDPFGNRIELMELRDYHWSIDDWQSGSEIQSRTQHN